VRATLTLPAGTGAERVREILKTLRERVVTQPKVDADSVRVRFIRLEPTALELQLFAYVLTSSWDEFVDIRQQIFLAALDVVAAAGVTLK
jgi:MscS family membrane protein